MREAVIIIPSRIGSKRIPRKALLEVEGKPLVRNVYDRCLESGLKTYVATDSVEIADLFSDAILTPETLNGSERVALAAKGLGLTNGDWIINVQGDKLVNPEAIRFFERSLIYGHDSYHTLYCMSEEAEGGVRVKVDRDGYATYFTRRAIPNSYHHCGIYAYTGAFLQRYLGFPSTWEHEENLEQMRALENGCRVRCFHFHGDSGRSINE